ncbi:MAG: mannose-1-phosphate guanylyltransferase [Anaerolineales bacterium]
MDEHSYAVIMAGGGGTRLWPVSRRNQPKQLLPLLGEETLFQSTFNRLADMFPSTRILVVTVEEQMHEMRNQVPSIPEENYLIEPSPRGTASVVGLAAAVLKKRDPEAVMAVLPSDHFIRNQDLFHYLLRAAFDVAAQNYLVTLGIAPLSPSIAYGYIQQGEPLKGEFKYPVYKVKGFKEKPDEKMAQGFMRTGGYSWNSGIFVWRAGVILSEIEKQMPALSTALSEISSVWDTPKQIEVFRAHWRGLKSETIDYGVMEHAENVAIVPASGLGWNDVGSWDTLFDVLFPDMAGNVSVNAQHLALETNNTLVYGAGNERLIVTIGLDDTVVVDSGDVLLICKADQAQKVREVVEHLKKHRQENYL